MEKLSNIIVFKHKNYRAGNIAKNKNGDLVFECFEGDEQSSSRLFYGLTKDGRNFFSNQPSYTKEININMDEIIDDYGYFNIYGIYNPINLFVSIKNDPNKGNEYFLSINSYYSTVELYNFNNDNNTHYIWSLNKFFNLDEDLYIFPYDYVLFELSKESIYFIAFIPKVNVYEDMIGANFIKKFRFKSFDSEAYEEIASISYNDYLDKRIIDTFFMDDYRTFVVLACEKVEIRRIENREYKYKFAFKFYNQNLKTLSYAKDIILESDILIDYFYLEVEGFFFKSI